MKYLLGMLFGYIVHDAIQPTAIGQALDKFSLPADSFTNSEGDTNVEASA